MTKSLIISAIAMAAATFAVSANAETAKPDAYFQIGAADAHIGGENFGAVNVILGKTLTPHFAVEAEGNIGVTQKTYHVGGVTAKAKIDYSLGAYVVGSLPVSANVDLIGRLGYAKGQIKVSASGSSATASDSGPAVGVGVRYFPKGGLSGVRADVTHFDFGDGFDGEIYQVSYVRRF
jgi:hypothetical protein